MSCIQLADAKAYLRIGSSTVTDTLVQILVDGAEDWIQEFCGIQFGEGFRTEYLDGGARNLFTERKPIRHVVSVVDRDNTGTSCIEDTDYYVKNDRITKAAGANNDTIYGAWTGRLAEQEARWSEGQGRWKVTYLCGYYYAAMNTTTPGADDGYAHTDVPAGLKVAILELVRRLYDNRGGIDSESASGWTINWLRLHESDIIDLLSPFTRMDV